MRVRRAVWLPVGNCVRADVLFSIVAILGSAISVWAQGELSGAVARGCFRCVGRGSRQCDGDHPRMSVRISPAPRVTDDKGAYYFTGLRPHKLCVKVEAAAFAQRSEPVWFWRSIRSHH